MTRTFTLDGFQINGDQMEMGRIDETAMIAMNARAKLDRVAEAEVAAGFLEQTFGERSALEASTRPARFPRRSSPRTRRRISRPWPGSTAPPAASRSWNCRRPSAGAAHAGLNHASAFAHAADANFLPARIELALQYARRAFNNDPDRSWEQKAFMEADRILRIDPRSARESGPSTFSMLRLA